MGTALLVLVVILIIAALVFGVVTLLSGEDPGLGAVEPDGRATALPNSRSLTEADLQSVRFDVTWRGYRMAQVDRMLRRTAYDAGYKEEMIAVLEAEVAALRDGRREDAELLRKSREAAASPESARGTVQPGAATAAVHEVAPAADEAPAASAAHEAPAASAAHEAPAASAAHEEPEPAMDEPPAEADAARAGTDDEGSADAGSVEAGLNEAPERSAAALADLPAADHDADGLGRDAEQPDRD